MIFTKTQTFIQKREWVLPLGLFFLFLALTLPGISWGAPSVWHPDEIVVRSIKALHGEWQFSEINFDYPDLPQYTMFYLGKLLLTLGKTDGDILVASRVLSAVLAGLTVVLTYLIARRIGGSVAVAGLSGLLLICVSEMSHNGRFAHNDTYLLFFVTLSVLCLFEYTLRRNRLWLYASFLTVGMAASSKYIGGSLVLAPLTVYLFEQRKRLRTNWLSIGETLFISTALAFFGFALGTPKALTWMAFYFKRLFSTLQWQANYGHQPDSLRGILGQYRVMAEGLGLALVLLFGVALIWAVWTVLKEHLKSSNSLQIKADEKDSLEHFMQLSVFSRVHLWLKTVFRNYLKARRNGESAREPQTKSFAVLLLAVLALDLPMTISYNYQLRYFLTLMPFLAILAAFFLANLHARAIAAGKSFLPLAVNLTAAAIILYSFARLLSLMLLVMNDARIPASAFMKTLPAGASLEHTYYPPTLPAGHFAREHNYPIYFVKGSELPPVNDKLPYNAGEAGLVKRETDFFVVDSFTSDKFNDPHYCETMPAECAFFKQLETGRTAHYQLLKEFQYTLPPWLPQIRFEFINPVIRIYERIP